MITELVKFKLYESTTEEQLISKSKNLINNFWKKQDVFIDAELVKDIKENTCCFMYHFKDMESVNAVGEKMRSSIEFTEFMQLIVPASINVTFYNQLKKW